MKYRIELAATAKADIRGQAQWLREQVSPAAADKWLAGLYKAIDTLQTRPLRCPVAAESDSFPGELKGDSHQIWRTQRVQVNVASLRFFLRSSTGPSRAFEPQSLGRGGER